MALLCTLEPGRWCSPSLLGEQESVVRQAPLSRHRRAASAGSCRGGGGAWEWRSVQCRESSSQGHLSLKTPVLDLRAGVQPSVQHPPLGGRGLHAVLGVGSFVFSLQLCCQAFCKPPALLGRVPPPPPRPSPPLSQEIAKTPSRSTLKACLLASTPSPVQGTQASSCPTPALGKQEAG